MLKPREHRGHPLALALTFVMLLATSGYPQASESLPGDLLGAVSAVKAENAALREQLGNRIGSNPSALSPAHYRLEPWAW